ncbi:C-C motif chemokine 19-like [Neoarius graeffei]|uniref:C-C motif chemokine 19-like n=1 Tax=Neoarius graeffei TaxID=443677 RepID=UPI00298BD679|nr:C-C motif chemokine 19-like [Neoarius graeffei]
MVRNSMMMQASALLVIALLFMCWNSAGATDGAEDCCLTTVNRKIPQSLVKSYYIQNQELNCRVQAVVFVTKKDRRLCAPPATKNNWVKKLINKLNKKSKKSSKGKSQ